MYASPQGPVQNLGWDTLDDYVAAALESSLSFIATRLGGLVIDAPLLSMATNLPDPVWQRAPGVNDDVTMGSLVEMAILIFWICPSVYLGSQLVLLVIVCLFTTLFVFVFVFVIALSVMASLFVLLFVLIFVIISIFFSVFILLDRGRGLDRGVNAVLETRGARGRHLVRDIILATSSSSFIFSWAPAAFVFCTYLDALAGVLGLPDQLSSDNTIIQIDDKYDVSKMLTYNLRDFDLHALVVREMETYTV
ncbi:hypothetical protein CTA1_10612 [Colletotrichum tanaceti]|uniref:Uncharacterized protein n=1 Tax=Colletotrichum tanaceti TaxID=1306861 RepID=A0A4U6XLJ1_9PEZI|nr:hypothetical protein CTA1_10612 [Colletotrichum tanaceti]